MRLAVFLVISVLINMSAFAQTRITQVGVYDKGYSGTEQETGLQIDLTRNVCSFTDTNNDGVISETEKVYEEFDDTIIVAEVKNEGKSDIRFNRMWVKIEKFDGTRKSAISKKYALISNPEVKAGESAKVFSFMMKAEGDAKYLDTKKGRLSISPGFKNMTVHLQGRTLNRSAVNLRARYTMSFSDFARCN